MGAKTVLIGLSLFHHQIWFEHIILLNKELVKTLMD